VRRVPFVVLGVLVALVPLLTAASPEQQKGGLTRLRQIVFQAADVATEVGIARGMFAAVGLDVEVTVTGSSTQQMRGLSDSTYDLASTAFDNVLAWSGREGAEIVALAESSIAESLQLPVIVRPEIRTWEDLRGRPLAVDAVDTAYALVLRRILLAHGLDLDRGDYTIVGVGAPTPRLESMQRGETFAAILNPPTDDQAVALGMIRFGDHREVLPEYPGAVWAVTRTFATQHRDVLQRFLRVWAEAIRWARANRQAAIELVSARQGLSPAAVAARLDELPTDATLSVPALQIVLGLRTQFDFSPPMGADLARYYDTTLYPAAIQQ
jgi:ABC-type nitrate/sulfonate/bicarbonate transport system substrate-binding protein